MTDIFNDGRLVLASDWGKGQKNRDGKWFIIPEMLKGKILYRK